MLLSCLECGKQWLPDDSDRWRAYLYRDDEDVDEEPELVVLCSDCSSREYGKARRQPAD